jgi:hypothetical protein
MNRKPWTDAEKWKLLRAAEAYGNRWLLLAEREDFGGRSPDALKFKHSRLGGWTPPPGTEELPLRADDEEEEPAAPPPRAPDDPVVLGLERSLLAARDELADARRKLRASHRDESTVEQLAATIRAECQPLPAVRPAAIRPPREGATPVDAVLLLSDEHADSKIHAAGAWGLERYDFNVFRARLHRLVQGTSGWLTKWLPLHRPERLWIFKLGDAIEGEIHPGPRHFANPVSAAIATGDAEAHAVQALHAITGLPVIVVCVNGNHGRRSPRKEYPDPHSHFDFLVATQLATRLSDQDGITVLAPKAWTAFCDVRGWVFALNHGDDTRGTWGIPWYGFTRRASRVQAAVGAAGARVDYLVYGHYHDAALTPAGGAQSWHNSAFPATSPFAAETMQGFTRPQQWLFIVDDDRGVQLPVPIYLRDEAREKKLHAGTWDPELGRRTVLDEVDPAHDYGGLHMIRAAS